MRGIDLFVVMARQWRLVIPIEIANKDPGLLIRLFELGQRADGISQTDLVRELGLNESHLSKLTGKLLKLKLISVTMPTADRRFRLLKTTAKAQLLLADLEMAILPLLPTEVADPFIANYNSSLPGNF